MESTLLKVGGMSCQGCVKSVTKVLSELPGVVKAEVSLERGEASVDYDADKITRDVMKRAVDDAGFEAA
ncbi:MAG: heavy-metal-associated domain-containing protein [Betaproteobacteria bacterium]|nr:heavy-metal-associated domain-containing protein [Betaproteobacteria bacterium]